MFKENTSSFVLMNETENNNICVYISIPFKNITKTHLATRAEWDL